MIFDVKYLPEVASTNQYAFELLSNGNDENDIAIRTGHQFAGKGAGDHTWESAPGLNILSSLIIHPKHIRPVDQFVLSKIAALAVSDIVSGHAPEADVRIKWPNDIFAGDYKISGILIQHQIMGESLNATVIGIGLNVNQQSFPPDLPNPVSLVNLTDTNFNLDLVFSHLLKQFDHWYSKSMDNDYSKIDEIYRSRLYRLEETREFFIEGKRKNARILDVDESGHLMLETGNKMEAYGVEEISFIL